MAPEQTFEIYKESSYVAREEAVFHPDDLAELGLVEYIYVELNATNGTAARCLVGSSSAIPRGYVKLSKRSRDKLGYETGLRVRVAKPLYQFINRGIPRVDEILNPEVRACPRLVEQYSDRVELINPENGFRLKIRLRADATAKENTIYIDRYKMLLLGYNPNAPQQNGYRIAVIPDVTVVPAALWDRIQGRLRRAVRATQLFLGNVFVGNREVTLRVGYIYPFDEHHNICRIHPNLRKFLGVEETDNLTVIYNDTEMVVPVMDVDPEYLGSVFQIHEGMEFEDAHLIIGISAYARNALGIPNIGTSVNVRRSMKAILFKHLNKLILPVLAVWLTVVQLFKEFKWGAVHLIAASAILLPIVVYTALSEERAKIK